MKSQVKKIDATMRELKIEVAADIVSSKQDEIYNELGKKIKVPGFRPGAIPRQILEQRHSDLAKEELLKILIPDAYEKSLLEHSLFPYASPEISDVNLKGDVLTFTAKVEVKPVIDVSGYKDIPLKMNEAQIKDEQVQEKVKELVEKKKREISDSFARSQGYKDLNELKEVLSKQMYLHAKEHAYQDALNQMFEFLLGKHQVPVPRSLLDRQLKQRKEEIAYRMRMYGKSEQETEQELKKAEGQLKQACEREIKIFLLLDEIGAKENIKSEGQEGSQRVIEFLFENAKWS